MILKGIDSKNGNIWAKAKLSIWSWTENIEIKINANGTIKIKSTCALPLQIVTWGKNKRNVNKIISHLT